MKLKPIGTILTLLALACMLTVTTACPRQRDGTPRVTDEQIRGGARVVKTAAEEFGRELKAEVESGELSAEADAALQPFLGEIVTLSTKVTDDQRNFDQLTQPERRQLLVDYVAALNDSAVRLDSAGALHLKSEAARKKFATATSNIRRGLSLARVVLAALPPPGQSTQ